MSNGVTVEYLSSLEGQPIAVMCAKFAYRGILVRADGESILLANPRAVEETGSATANSPVHEDPIPSDLLIRLDFVECICQPAWVWHEMKEGNE